MNRERELEQEIEAWKEYRKKYNALLDKENKKEMKHVSIAFHILSDKKPMVEAELKGIREERDRVIKIIKSVDIISPHEKEINLFRDGLIMAISKFDALDDNQAQETK